MTTIEIFYNGKTDNDTPQLIKKIQDEFGNKITLQEFDTSEDQIPEDYGIINPPVAIINKKQKISIEGKEGLEEIVRNVIF